MKEQQILPGHQPAIGQWFPESQQVHEEAYSQHSPRSSEHSAHNLANPDAQAHHCQDVAEVLGAPGQMLRDRDFALKVEEWLEMGNSSECSKIIEWLLPVAIDLSLSVNGTKVIQMAMKVGCAEDQERLLQCMRGRVRQLLDSHHGNFVLQQSVHSMPPHAVKSILDELSHYPGGWAALAKHRFGCRVAERVLEHCSDELTRPLVDAVCADIDATSRNPFANYVVQHILEQQPQHRRQVVLALKWVGIPILSHHRVASNIVEKVLDHGGVDEHRLLAEAILEERGAVVAMADNRYGSFTIRRLVDIIKEEPLKNQLLQPILAAESRLRSSKHGRQVLARARAAFSGTTGYVVGGA